MFAACNVTSFLPVISIACERNSGASVGNSAVGMFLHVLVFFTPMGTLILNCLRWCFTLYYGKPPFVTAIWENMFSKHLKQTQVLVVNLTVFRGPIQQMSSNNPPPALEAMTELFAAYCANRNAIACGVTSQDVFILELKTPREWWFCCFSWGGSCLLLFKDDCFEARQHHIHQPVCLHAGWFVWFV